MAAVQRQRNSRSTVQSRGRAAPFRPIDLGRNAAILGLLWYAYALVRTLSADEVSSAFINAGQVLTLQQRLGLDIEAGIQAILGFDWLFRAANWYYLVHFPVTVAALVCSYVLARHSWFVQLRNSLIGTTAIAVLIHASYPLAPPRMIGGYLDSALVFGPNPYALPGSEAANQYAAMPSMHVGWAVLVGLLLWSVSGDQRWKALGVIHVLFTSIVVVLTANHYVLDVVIGAGMAVLVWLAISKLTADPLPQIDEAIVAASEE